jgi:hypothetical protein
LEQGASITIDIYIKTLVALARSKRFSILVHPVLPVLKETRGIVKVFNRVLKRAVHAHAELSWLDMYEQLLTPTSAAVSNAELGDDLGLVQLLAHGGPFMKAELELDGTHVNPKPYIPILQEAIDKAVAAAAQSVPT